MSNFDKVLILRLLTVCIRRKIKLSFSKIVFLKQQSLGSPGNARRTHARHFALLEKQVRRARSDDGMLTVVSL